MAFDIPYPPATGPARWDGAEGNWLLTRRADAFRALRSDAVPVAATGEHVRRLGARTQGFPALAGLLSDMPILQNAPAHAASRAWLKPVLQDVAGRWPAEALEDEARILLRDLDPFQEVDATGSLAGSLPNLVTARTLDLASEALTEACDAQLRIMDRWSWATPLRDYSGLEADAAAIGRLFDGHPLLAAAGTPPAAWATLAFLLIGALTSAALIGNAIHVLALRPDLQERLRAAPRDIGPFIEECLRFCGPVKRVAPRITRDAIALEGGRIGAREMIVIRLDSANRDPAAYADPDRFDMDRPGPPALAFTAGAHTCPGAFLGRLEARAMIGGLLERFQILPGATQSRLSHSKHFLMFETLPIRLEPAPGPAVRTT